MAQGDTVKCTHFWIVDSKGFARCKHCPATKQCKGYEHQKLKPSALGSTKRGEFGIDPNLSARSYVRVT